MLNSKKHSVFAVEVNKIALSANRKWNPSIL